MKYVIDSKTYEKHIRDEVHLYGLLHQLAFLAGKVKDEEDICCCMSPMTAQVSPLTSWPTCLPPSARAAMRP